VALRTAHNIQNGVQLKWGDATHHIEPQKAPPTICFNTFNAFDKRIIEGRTTLPKGVITNRFPSDEFIAEISSPILLMHGKADTTTHYHHSMDLEEASKGKNDGSCDFQVAKLVNHILFDTNSQKKDAFQAIDNVLGTHLTNDRSKRYEGKKEETIKIITDAIQAKYKDDTHPAPSDKFAAFVEEVQRVDIGSSRKNPLKTYKGKADLELMDGITHSCKYDKVNKIDPRQLTRVVDVMQNYLHGLNMCPAAPKREDVAEQAHGNDQGAWSGRVTEDGKLSGLSV